MYRVSHMMYRISHIVYSESWFLGPGSWVQGRPWEATGSHGRPREATGGHGRPREATGGHGGTKIGRAPPGQYPLACIRSIVVGIRKTNSLTKNAASKIEDSRAPLLHPYFRGPMRPKDSRPFCIRTFAYLRAPKTRECPFASALPWTYARQRLASARLQAHFRRPTRSKDSRVPVCKRTFAYLRAPKTRECPFASMHTFAYLRAPKSHECPFANALPWTYALQRLA